MPASFPNGTLNTDDWNWIIFTHDRRAFINFLSGTAELRIFWSFMLRQKLLKGLWGTAELEMIKIIDYDCLRSAVPGAITKTVKTNSPP